MGKKKKESPYKHDTFLLRTSHHRRMSRLSLEQKGMLLDMIFEYAKTEYIPEDYENDSSDNALLYNVFDEVKENLDYNWAEYKEKCEQREHDGTLNAYIGALMKGQKLSDEGIKFLKDNGYLTQEYLVDDRKVPISVVKKLFQYIKSGEAEDLPFS